MASTINASTSSGLVNTADTSGILQLQTANTAALTIDASQNVGIGTASPASKLDVSGTAGITSFTGTTPLGLTVRGATSSTDYSGIDFRSANANGGSIPVARIGVVAGGGGTVMNFGTSVTYASGVTNTAMSINPVGNVQFNATIGVGGATPSTSGAGITFPATQSASTDANTLDDYEEGTFTATLSASPTPPTTPVTTTGTYVKIGKQITVSFAFSNVDTTGASGSLVVTGLPFSAHASIPMIGSPPMLYSIPSTQNYNVWYITSTTLNLYAVGNSSGWAPENISAGTGKYVWSTVTYITS
jgi:hypothetical protein